METLTTWEWMFYGRGIAELGLLIWAMVLIAKAHRQMKRMKKVMDKQSMEINELREELKEKDQRGDLNEKKREM